MGRQSGPALHCYFDQCRVGFRGHVPWYSWPTYLLCVVEIGLRTDFSKGVYAHVLCVLYLSGTSGLSVNVYFR